LTPADWSILTRLGEAPILAPFVMACALALALRPHGRDVAAWWSATFAIAALVTLATKVAFLGWGIGSAALDFTGVSGHAMCAAAVYPTLLAAVTRDRPRRWRVLAITAGVVLALLIGWSRIVLGAHSPSEVVAGLLLGGAGAALTLHFSSPLSPRLTALSLIVPCAALLAVPGPVSEEASHGTVVRLSLALSGRAVPYSRAQLLRQRSGALAKKRWAPTAAAAPMSSATTKPGTLAGAMPANVSLSIRPDAAAGFANDVDAVNQ